MSKAVAKKEENTAVANYNPALMDDMAIYAKDIILPRVLCMQSTSNMVQDGKAAVGELRDSVTGKLLCKKGESVEAILYKPFKTWVIFKNDTFDSLVPFDETNAAWTWEEKIGDHLITRKQVLNYYVAFPNEIKEGGFFPRVIGFQSTAYKTGRKVESKRTFLKPFKRPLASHVFEVNTVQKENEKGRWFIPDVSDKRDATNEEIAAIGKWAEIIGAAQSVTVDDSEFKGDGDATEDNFRDF